MKFRDEVVGAAQGTEIGRADLLYRPTIQLSNSRVRKVRKMNGQAMVVQFLVFTMACNRSTAELQLCISRNEQEILLAAQISSRLPYIGEPVKHLLTSETQSLCPRLAQSSTIYSFGT
jgi:hypothetical protein